jgi:quinol monooxygenase YgiN
VEDPSEYVLVEGFRDGDAGKAHVTSEHFKKFVGEAPALLASTPSIISSEIDATGWGEMGEITV